ncbi:hypothetical protein C5167_008531 [Papaver somniferum]|uniref:Protein kinase domain-containing protein n=1 Tax=Papaver somniferum TaxID=3469 RepID=A0A4Y7JUT0_PAPSO|nr:hypothetical protein C5167_008531 [Papaver somniferum]
MTFISQVFDTTDQEILKYNPPDPLIDLIVVDERLEVPFTCDCIRGERLGHVFTYTLKPGDTYEKLIEYYANLTSMEGLMRDNSYNPVNILDGSLVNVTVDCSCGDEKVCDYELFVTYPLLPRDDLYSIAEEFRISRFLLQRYNPSSDFSSGKGLVFIPGRGRILCPYIGVGKLVSGDIDILLTDATGNYRRFKPKLSTGGLAAGAIVGIAVGIVAFAVLGVCTCIGLSRRKKAKKALLLPKASKEGVENSSGYNVRSFRYTPRVESSMKEILDSGFEQIENKFCKNKCSLPKAAIKKMDMQASKEFLAELKVLTRVHHLNLVRLIGYCVEDSLFLVYEFIDSGNLSEHLRGIEKEPLPWSTRLHIALDSARGLEYIQEHTVPVYTHRDIKSVNILVDKNFRGKVADFGLTKLSEVGSGSLQTRVVGTFGYMPPELYLPLCATTESVSMFSGVRSPTRLMSMLSGLSCMNLYQQKKLLLGLMVPVLQEDCLFGFFLYLDLVHKSQQSLTHYNLFYSSSDLEINIMVSVVVIQFEEVLNQPGSDEDLCKLVDPRLGDDYPSDSVRKLAQLAKACTQENPQLRPTMRSIVVALMTLSSFTEDWDVGSFYENHGLVNLMSGK